MAKKKRIGGWVDTKNGATNDATKGGLFKGQRHSEGGIKAIVDGNTPIETESGEIILTRKASKKYCKELSKMNQDGGGVAIPCDGDMDGKDEFGDGGMIAPNGTPSNLTAEQYKLVRTPEFKAWFGDWENDPENASKVVDENGEPMVVYHGTNAEWNVFDFNKIGEGSDLLGKGIYLTENKNVAYFYANKVSQKKYIIGYREGIFGTDEPIFEKDAEIKAKKHELVYSFFLNAVNPAYLESLSADFLRDVIINSLKEILGEEYAIRDFDYKLSFVRQNSDKIQDYRGEVLYFIQQTPDAKSDIINFIKQNYDCIIFKPSNEFENVKEKYYNYVVYNSNQIKLADGTNTTFDGNNPDIRFDDGGKTATNLYSVIGNTLIIVETNGKPLSKESIKNVKKSLPLYVKLTTEQFKPLINENLCYCFRGEDIMYFDENGNFKCKGTKTKNENVDYLWSYLKDSASYIGTNGSTCYVVLDGDTTINKIERLINEIPQIGFPNKNDFKPPFEVMGVDADLSEMRGKTVLLMNERVSEFKNGGKVEKVMHEFKEGELKTPQGKVVTDRKQAVAIALNEARREEYGGGGKLSEDKMETYTKWKYLVNMSKSELEKFYNSEEGKEAGLSSSEAKELGIHSGRESARWIIKMKETPKEEWTDTMWDWAKRQISFISRMSGGKGNLYDDKGNKTRKHTSLLIWGHNPEKFEEGGLSEKYGAGGKATQEKTLVALHNINARQIIEADEQGGLIVPSIAVLKKNEPYYDFGNITLICSSDLINPEKNSDARAFEGDIYSPSVPRKQYYLNPSYKNFSRKIMNVVYSNYRDISSLIGNLIEEDFGTFPKALKGQYAEGIYNDFKDKMQPIFLIDKGIKFEIPMREQTHYLWNNFDFTLTPEQKIEYKKVYDKYIEETRGSSRDLTQETMAELFMIFIDIVTREREKKEQIEVDNDIDLKEYNDNLYKRIVEQHIGDGTWISHHALYKLSDALYEKKEVDKDALNGVYANKLKGKKTEYDAWLRNLIKRFQGEAYFEDGNRKRPYNTENLVDALNRHKIRGVEKGMTFGYNRARSFAHKELNSISDMHKVEHKLVSKERMNEVDKKNGDDFFKLADKLHNKYPDTWNKLDSLGKAIASYFSGNSAETALARNDFKTNYGLDEFKAYCKQLKDSPVDYFEVKIGRAVKLSDFKFAIVPQNTPKEAIEVLKKNGVKIRKYETDSNELNRTKIVTETAEKNKLLFSNGGKAQSQKSIYDNAKVSNWSEIPPEWKYTTAINEVKWEANPTNEGFNRIFKNFAGEDDLRPVLRCANFTQELIQITDAHKLICIKAKTNFKGVYEFVKNKNTKQGEKFGGEGKYPNFAAVTPSDKCKYVYLIDIEKLKTYLTAIENGEYSNKITKKVILKYKDSFEAQVGYIGVNSSFMLDVLGAWLMLGIKGIYFRISAPNRAIIMSPNREALLSGKIYGNCDYSLLMPVFIDGEEANVGYLGAMDIDYARECSVYFDLSDNNIHNHDGSVASVGETKQSDNEFFTTKEYSLLKRVANGKSALPILETMIIKDGVARVTNLEVEISKKGISVQDGIYRLINGSLSLEKGVDIDKFPMAMNTDFFGKATKSKTNGEYRFKEFADKFQKATLCVGNDELRPVMLGVYLDADKVVSTDAHCLYRSKVKTHPKDIKAIVPHKILSNLLSVNDGQGISYIQTKTATSDNGVALITMDIGKWGFYARCYDGKFPNYESVIPLEYEYKLTLNAKSLKKLLGELNKNERPAFEFIEREGKTKMYALFFEYESSDSPKSTREIGEFDLYEYEKVKNYTDLLVMPQNPAMDMNMQFGREFFKKMIEFVDDDKCVMIRFNKRDSGIVNTAVGISECNYVLPKNVVEKETKVEPKKEEKPYEPTANDVGISIEGLQASLEYLEGKDKEDTIEAIEGLKVVLEEMINAYDSIGGKTKYQKDNDYIKKRK